MDFDTDSNATFRHGYTTMNYSNTIKYDIKSMDNIKLDSFQLFPHVFEENIDRAINLTAVRFCLYVHVIIVRQSQNAKIAKKSICGTIGDDVPLTY